MAHLLSARGTALIFCTFENWPFLKASFSNEKLEVDPSPFTIVKRFPTGEQQITTWALKSVMDVALICHKQTNYWRNLRSEVPEGTLFPDWANALSGNTPPAYGNNLSRTDGVIFNFQIIPVPRIMSANLFTF